MSIEMTGESGSVSLRGGLLPSVARGWCTIRELAHGIRLAWISTTSIGVGSLLFLIAPQAQDLFLEVRGSMAAGTLYWLAFYGAVMLGWMLPVYLSTHWILWHFREGGTEWTREEPVRDWVRRLLPTLLVCGCLAAVLAGQIMALVNAPTIADENMSRSLSLSYQGLWQSAAQCGDGGSAAVLLCKFVRLGNYTASFYSDYATSKYGPDLLILYFYVVLASIMMWLGVRAHEQSFAAQHRSLTARITRAGLWLFGAAVLALVGGATWGVLVETSEILNYLKLTSELQSGCLVIAATAWLLFIFVLRFFTTRGWKIKNAATRTVLAVLFYGPMLGVLLPLYGFARNELAQPISIGHMAALPAVTAGLLWLTWHALGARSDGRATRFGERLLSLLGRAARTDEASASSVLVSPLFHALVATSFAAAALLSTLHPVNATSSVSRSLLLPFVLGFFIPGFTYLSYWSAKTRAPLVIGLIAGVALLSSLLHDPHDVRTVGTTAARPDLAASVEQWAAANGCKIVLAPANGAAPKATGCPSPIIVSAAGGASRAGFLVGGVIGKLVDEPVALRRQGHAEKINQSVLSRDKKYIATAGEGGTGRREEHTVRISETLTGRQTAVLRVPFGSINAVGFDRTDRRILAIISHKPQGYFGVQVWDLQSGRLVATFSEHTDELVNVMFTDDPDRVVSVGKDNTAYVWSLSTGQASKSISLKAHTAKINDAELVTDRGLLLTSSDDKTVRLWNLETGEPTGHVLLHPDKVQTVKSSALSGRILTFAEDGILRLWPIPPESGSPIELKGDNSRLVAGEFNSEPNRLGKFVFAKSEDGALHIWDATDARMLSLIRVEGGTVLAGDISGNGQRVVYLASDGTLRTWDVSAGRDLLRVQADVKDMTFVGISHDGSLIFTTAGATVTTWDADTLREVARFERSWFAGRALRPFEQQVFAISAVSGGALGAVVSYAALADSQNAGRAINGRGRPPCDAAAATTDADWFAPYLERPVGDNRPWQPHQSWQGCLENILAGDFLSPVFYSLNRDDLLSADNGVRDLLRIERRGDRAAVLEHAWEMRYARLTRQPSPIGSSGKELPTLAQSMLDVRARTVGSGHWLPILLLNGTSVNSGRRIITSDMSPPFGAFIDSDDLHSMLGAGRTDVRRDIRLSTGATMSARFPVISPHGSIRNDQRAIVDRVVDGGYYENFGAATTLELVRELKGYGLDPFVILVNNEPTNSEVVCRDTEGLGGGAPPRVSENAAFSLVLSPLKAVVGTRSARGSHASVQLCNELGSERFAYVTVALDPRNPRKALSMSWWLSKHVQKYLSDQLDPDGINREAFARIEAVR